MPSESSAVRPKREGMRIPSAPEVLDYARRLGARRAVYRATYVAANKAVALSTLDCLRLRPEHVNHALTDVPGMYECRFLEGDEVRRLASEVDDPVGRMVPGAATARGDPCYAVLAGGRPVNIGFYAERPTPVLNDLVLHFTPPRWYMYGGFTDVAHRGRRLHALGILLASLELFARGVPELVTLVERTNYKAMVSTLRMGWRPCGTLYRVGAGGRTWLGRDAESRAAGMRLERRQASPES